MFKRTAASAAVMALVAAAPATAQDAQRIEVTGSRVLRTELTSNVPIVSVTADTLKNLGIENLADMMAQLPSFAASFGESRTQSTFSGVEQSGLNFVNLRNLGSERTLVLINGRRAHPGSSTAMSVDLNSIPTANIERVEIITGGASAIYGADAVAGVVNIITRKNFEGVEVSVGYGASKHGDNKNPTASVMFGGKLGTDGRALLTLQVDNQGKVSCADRYICSEDFLWTTPDSPIRGPNAYSGVGTGGRFFVDGTGYVRRNGTFTDSGGALIPFNRALDGYNRNATRDIAIPTKRMMAAADLEYALDKKVTAFAELNYAQTRINSSFEAHPFQSDADTVGGPGGIEASIPINNPFIPTALRDAALAAGQDSITWWQRFSGLGTNRGASSERSSVRTVAGLKGDLDSVFGVGRAWRWELSHVYGRTSVNLGTEGLVGLQQLYDGLRVEVDPSRPGQYRCASETARLQGCVPINPFADYTSAMAESVRLGSNANGTATLNDTVAYISGSPFDLPAGAVRTVLGAEYRTFSGGLDYDTVVNRGLATGNLIGDTDRVKTRTRELFAELVVPVLADKPLARELNIESAYRHSSTSEFSYNTWKFGGDWEPVDGFRVRAMKARSVRTPFPSELSGISTTAGVVNDPCTAARRNANPTRAANCAADGVPTNYTPDQTIEQSVQGFTGGNSDLQPEVGTTTTLGFVWQPRQARGFSLSVDRFRIKVEKMIASVERQLAVNLCYDTPNRVLCDTVRRGQNPLIPGASYVLNEVDEQLENVASQTVSGFDIDTRYRYLAGAAGDFDFSMLLTLYDKAQFVPVTGEAPVDLLGQAGGSTTTQGYIKRTANFNAGWRRGSVSANWNMRYIGRADMGVGSTDLGFPRIGSHTYHNVRVGYNFRKDAEVFAGITNLFDKKPPFFASGYSGTQALDTIPGYYDVFGRSYFVGLRAKF